eukprot:6219668-Karenia_brevis.AAC.1
MSQAGKHGQHPGYALDLTTGWSLDDPKQATEAFALREAIRPKLLVGSPECGPFSLLLGFHGITAKVSEKLEKATEHLDMCCQMYYGQ